MKRLLILGAAVQCCKVVETAKKMGIYTIVTDIAPSKPMLEIADEVLTFSVKDVENIAKWCENNPVDGIINTCIDLAQKTQEELCSRFGLPKYGNAEQVYCLTNKERFKEICVECGVDIIDKYSERDAIDGKVEFPVIVKPEESSGSRGMSICTNMNELLTSVNNAKNISNNGKVIIEKYMGDCQDFTMSYFVIDKEPYLYCTHDRYLGKKEDGLDRQCVCQYGPSKYLDLYLQNVDLKIKNMIRKIGIENGPVFFQGFFDGDKLRVYDPGIRFPGTEYETAYLKANGINLMEIAISLALGENISSYAKKLENSYKLNGMRTASLFIDCCPGIISKFEGLDEIRNIPEVTRVSQKAFIGDVIPASGDVKQRVCEVTLLFENNPEHIDEVIKKVQTLINVEDINGESMIVSPFDIKNIYNY